MSVAFWTAELKTSTPVDVQPPEGYVLNLSLAALSRSGKGSQVIKVKTVSIDGEDIEAVIGTLKSNQVEQINFNLLFGYDVPVTFSLSGDAQAKVYLSGFFYFFIIHYQVHLKFITCDFYVIDRILSTCTRRR